MNDLQHLSHTSSDEDWSKVIFPMLTRDKLFAAVKPDDENDNHIAFSYFTPLVFASMRDTILKWHFPVLVMVIGAAVYRSLLHDDDFARWIVQGLPYRRSLAGDVVQKDKPTYEGEYLDGSLNDVEMYATLYRVTPEPDEVYMLTGPRHILADDSSVNPKGVVRGVMVR